MTAYNYNCNGTITTTAMNSQNFMDNILLDKKTRECVLASNISSVSSVVI